ncbi:MAG: AAA family ATPase [Alphaproteobacteria bacterium]|nr:AAA family ATPase [Alphaproteobacteria bacterium]
MRLKQFRVTNFRSVDDSGWLEAESVTALIGVNESGKTNLLLPLWKLKPALDGEIQPTSDFPKTKFGEIRKNPGEYRFIQADFLSDEHASTISTKAGISKADVEIVRVSRFFDGRYEFEFPNYKVEKSIGGNQTVGWIAACNKSILAAPALKQEATIQKELISRLSSLEAEYSKVDALEAAAIKKLKDAIDGLIPKDPPKSSAIVPIIKQLSDTVNESLERISSPPPGSREDVQKLVLSLIPSFVYYSNYGNLDSEIYLPHVVHNMERDDLGAKEAAKVRTLRVLFSFVDLQPEEILELGRDFKEPNGQNRSPRDAEIAEIAEKKRTRSILLQSAGATLTTKFREWWKQGDYRFRFEADGNHFRIWVADDRRPTEVELENRSTGLQWFLSFYLVFLVESEGEHKRSILLLDEPGMSLHPLAQRDLSAFFENLTRTNQIIYTSHSPFLVDADRLDRARKVYVAADGTTKATSNLRHSDGKGEQSGAAYAVHSALNMSVAESLLVGCQPILVEGASDQHYLTAIKSLLLSLGRIKPKRELVFPPCGGGKTAKVVAAILTGRDDMMPKILLDDDVPGKKVAASLTQGLYANCPERIISVSKFVGFEGAEIEDLFPVKFLSDEIDRIARDSESRLSDEVKDAVPFVQQVESWALRQKVDLGKHWKVELAIRAKQRALARGAAEFPEDTLAKWVAMFEDFQ